MTLCLSCREENPGHARFCLACGAPLAEPAAAAEERKVVSVLFVDLVGFTDRSDRADPEDVRATLRPYHERLKQEVERFGGTVEKFVGDAVMAVFGAPVAHEDDPERAVRAALRCLEAVEELGLQVRGAVNTGEAVVALSARPERGEGIVTGDVVNTAARLQGVAPIGGIVVGESTYRATRAAIDYTALDPVELKGKAEPVALWRAVGARSRFGVDVEHRTRSPFVGRARELTLLQETFERSMDAACVQLVTVTGEPGVGKTRLVSEFRQWLDDQPDLVYWRQGRCLPYGEGITFWALGEIVKAHAGILETDSQEDAAAKLAAAAEVAEPADREWVESRLALLLGLGSDGSNAERTETFTAWRRFLEGVAATRPLVVVVEDLHWADPALIEFLDHLADWTTAVPLFLLCTARPELHERHAGWGGGKRNSSTLSLSPLTPDDTTRLLSALLEQAVLPAETHAALLERAGGNPLYAEEFVQMLVDRGVLERRGRTYAVAADAAIPVPETVHALIAARLDTLAPERKALLQDAAVVGKVFWSGALVAMGDREPRDVEDAMRELVRKEIVRPARVSSMAGETEFSFWHLTIRDVAYGQIPRDARAEKHRAAAEWLEQAAGDRAGEQAEVLAHHYNEALKLAHAAGRDALAEELRGPAVDVLLRAGDRALLLDVARASSYLSRAVELTQPGDPRDVWARFQLVRAQVMGHLEATDQGAAELKEIIAAFRARGDRAGEGAAVSTLGTTLWHLGEGALATEATIEAVEILEELPPSEELAKAYALLGFHQMVAGRPEEAFAYADRGVALARELGEVSYGLVMGLQARGGARCDRGDAAGIDDLREALDVAREAGMATLAAVAYVNLADYVWTIDGPRAALDLHRSGIEYAQRRGINTRWAEAETLWMLFELGEWDELVGVADSVLVVASGQEGIIARTFKALVLAWRGSVDDAAALAGDFLPAARSALDPQVYQPALAATAVIEQRRGDARAALAAVDELAALLEDRPAGFHGVGVLDGIRVALENDAPDLARRLVARVKDSVRRERNVALSARAALAEAAGDDEARALYLEAAEAWRTYEFALEEALALCGAARSGDVAAEAAATEILSRLGVVAAEPDARTAASGG